MRKPVIYLVQNANNDYIALVRAKTRAQVREHLMRPVIIRPATTEEVVTLLTQADKPTSVQDALESDPLQGSLEVGEPE
jgi:hypothetical protein